MALSLDSISSEARIRAPRMVLLGVDKIGKSEFACGTRFENGKPAETGLNNPVVLPIKGEEGIDELVVPSFPTLGGYAEVLEALGVLYRGGHDHKTAVIDSASSLEPLVWDHVCAKHNVQSIEKVGGGYGKGYTEAAAAFRGVLEGLDALRTERGMASIIIGHIKIKRFDDPNGDSYDRYQFDVHDKVANLLFRWADLILFCNTKVVVKKDDAGFGKEERRGIDITGGQRFLFTQKRPAHPGGGRGIYGQLPYELPLDYSAFESAVADAISERNSK